GDCCAGREHLADEDARTVAFLLKAFDGLCANWIRRAAGDADRTELGAEGAVECFYYLRVPREHDELPVTSLKEASRPLHRAFDLCQPCRTSLGGEVLIRRPQPIS